MHGMIPFVLYLHGSDIFELLGENLPHKWPIFFAFLIISEFPHWMLVAMMATPVYAPLAF
jgi:hypothetical protein